MGEWKRVRFSDLASPDRRSFSIGPFGSAITKDNYVAVGVPVVRGVNLGRGRFLDDAFVYISEQKADELRAANVTSGDLVFTHRGTIGQVSMIPRSAAFERYVLSSSQVKARLDESIACPAFYYYWFRSPEGQNSLLANASTVGVPGIASPLATIRSLDVPHPDINEQRAIAAVLGALDDKIAINERIASAALDLAVAEYEFLGSHRGWPTMLLAETARWYSGGTPRTSEPAYWDGDIPWISAKSLQSPWIDCSDRNVSRLGVQNGTRVVPENTVIFVVRGSSLDSEFRVGLTQREVAFGQDCKALRTVANVDPTVLLIALKARDADVLKLVDHAGHGAGRLSTDLISKFEVRLPSPDQLAEARGLLRPLAEAAARMKTENSALVLVRDALLPKLMSGELRVQDGEKVVEDAT